jgi:hypothetical protein
MRYDRPPVEAGTSAPEIFDFIVVPLWLESSDD